MVKTNSVKRERKVSVNLGDGQTVNTLMVRGKLDAVIIDNDNQVEIIIESVYGYLIMKRHLQRGIEYIAPRTRAITQLSDRAQLMDTPDMEKFNLNENIIITLIGPEQTNVNLILRFS